MQKLYRTAVSAALTALLLPVLILSAVGAVRSAGASETRAESPAEEASAAAPADGLAQTPGAEDCAGPAEQNEKKLWDASQTVPLLTEDGMRTLALSDYLVGVLLGELPPQFEDAAVEAQAVAARTFTLRQLESGKHNGCLCADPGCCQAWISAEEAREKLGQAYEPWLERVRKAVSQTDGEVLCYDGKLIEAAYFSCSGGRTEDAAAVWGGETPYLVSVDSPGEESAPRYSETADWTAAAFRSAILEACPAAKLSGAPEDWFGAWRYTDGGGVESVEIGGQAVTGTTLRRLLGLNSTCISLELDGDTLHFTTLGFGHRVGLSQYGANAMALAGEDYRAILAHYYSGTELARMQTGT